MLILAFESGLRLVYKPRSVAPEALLAVWVEWMTAHGFDDAPPVARTWARDGYGWQEYVAAESLREPSEAERYFRRAGALVALGYALRAGDLHAENLVATRRGPVVVDAEMLLQPLPESAVDPSGRPRAEADPQGHALASALVVDPSRVSTIAWGGLDPPPEGLGEPEPRFTGIGSDALALASERSPLAAGANVARLAGRALAAGEYREALLAGFAAAYRFLLARRSAILTPGGALAVDADHPVRILFRPSRQYATVLQMSTAPARLADGREAGLLLEALLAPFAGRRERPPLWPLVAEERAAIERLDVPYFTLPASATEPRSAAGEAVSGVFALSGLEASRAGLERWSESDLARQLRLLGEALEHPPAALSGAIDGTLTLAGGGRELAQRLRQRLADEPPATLDDTWSAASLYSGWSGRALVAAGIAATLGEEWARREVERAGQRALTAARAAARAEAGRGRRSASRSAAARSSGGCSGPRAWRGSPPWRPKHFAWRANSRRRRPNRRSTTCTAAPREPCSRSSPPARRATGMPSSRRARSAIGCSPAWRTAAWDGSMRDCRRRPAGRTARPAWRARSPPWRGAPGTLPTPPPPGSCSPASARCSMRRAAIGPPGSCPRRRRGRARLAGRLVHRGAGGGGSARFRRQRRRRERSRRDGGPGGFRART